MITKSRIPERKVHVGKFFVREKIKTHNIEPVQVSTKSEEEEPHLMVGDAPELSEYLSERANKTPILMMKQQVKTMTTTKACYLRNYVRAGCSGI